ncbi:MAG: outer membrane beta-barrel family protein, partial [Bacteroidota bacterium]|nr:outer membrane beta-barrel family protein [Bacteroidota bacterium]
DMVLTKTTGNLKAVEVNTTKPMIEIKADKTIFNVEGSVNAVGQDALELLRKSPGVMVDKDDNISLSGKNGVRVYIDGRPTPLAGADLAAYLKSLQSSSIESIEIITNPSAKYDAAGNAGIINIKLKKNKSYGTNGSVNAGYAIGITPKYNTGFSLNNRNKIMNVFGNYNFNHRRNENTFNLNRVLLDTMFDQRSSMLNGGESHNFKAGADFFINKKSTIGLMVNGNVGHNTFSNISRTPITYIPTGQVYRLLVADNSSESRRNNVNLNINYRYADTSGHELNMDADHGIFRIRSNQMQPNYYYDASGNTLQESRIYNMIAPTNIDINTFKTDYEQNFKKGRLGLGGKISYVKSANDFQRYNVISNGKNLDTLRSNDFNYKENINAVYANYNRQFKGIMIQAGLRMENTHAEGRSNGYKLYGNSYQVYDSTFKRNYTDVFPSAAITFNKKPTSQFTFTYSRRIDRPAYQDLNPFEFKLDEYTFQKGNTQLRPQYTNSFEIIHSYKYKLTTKFGYSHVNDVFTQLVDTLEKSKSFLTKKNLATQDITSLNISYPYQHKWYSVFVNLNSYYSHYKANLGIGRTIDLDVYAFNIYSQHTFKLGKGWTGELSGWYNSPSIWQGTFKMDAMWSIDGGLQKTIFKGKGNIKASVSDIFKSLQFGGKSTFAGQITRVNGSFESRQFKLNLTYRLGSNQVKSARQRKTGLEDESQRVGSQGGGISNN